MEETGGGNHFYDQQEQRESESAAALEHVALHKEVVQNMRYQPWDMGRKLRVLRRAKSFVRQHEGALQQRLAESRTAKDVFARGRLLLAKVYLRHLVVDAVTISFFFFLSNRPFN